MDDSEYDFNLTSLRDKLNKLNNLAGAAANSPTRILTPDEFMAGKDSFVGKSNVQLNQEHNSDVSHGNTDSKSGDMSQKDSMHAHGLQHPETRTNSAKSYAGVLKPDVNQKKANFRSLAGAAEVEGVDVLLPMQSVLEVNGRLANSLYGYFLGDRLAFPVVETYVKNTWAKFGLRKVMMNTAGFFFFQFESKEGLDQVLEKGPWMIRSTPIFLKEWSPNVCLAKQDLTNVPVWVKMYDVPLAAYTEDGLSMLATKLGKPLLLDSYTSHMCLQSWGRHSFARALIEIDASQKLKTELIVGIPSINGEGFTKEVVSVEYEWQPPHCEHCKVFGHKSSSCPARMKEAEQVDKTVHDDGFVQVTRRKGKGTSRQVEGIKLSKPKPHLVYKRKLSSSSQPKEFTHGISDQVASMKPNITAGANSSEHVVDKVSSFQNPTGPKPGYKDGASSSTTKPIDTHNNFSVLGGGVDDSDDDEVEVL